jgi:type IV secretion system protein VirB9
MKHSLRVVLAAILAATSAAAVVPRPGPGDKRIHVVDYDPEQVVELRGTLGYQFSVEFDQVEEIESVAIGDALTWQVTPNRRANLLFLKPMSASPDTNMTVVTNLRSYFFQLSAQPHSDKRVPLVSVRFIYPAPAFAVVAPPPQPSPPQPPEERNVAYTYTGSTLSLPVRVFDDGERTYFDFKAREDRPAIYAIDPDGQESVVNAREREGLVVIDRLARAFVLRRGSEVTYIYNDGFPAPEPSELKPRPKKSFWSR